MRLVNPTVQNSSFVKRKYTMSGKFLVIGLGEVGKPLFELISDHFDVVGIDLKPVEFDDECEVMHLCYPFQIPNFIGQCVEYINKYKPKLTVINSTVSPGTTRAIYQKTGTALVYSPVRGKHARMKQELLHYVKFIGGIDQVSGQEAANHFQSIGMKTKLLSSPESAELAKLTETTYFGVLIAWAQEVERYCDYLSLDYDEIVSIFDEIGYLPPVKFTPGVIGGHCVMPNIKLLKTVFQSDFLDALEKSNGLKIQKTGTKSI
jgi:UDP-N-acetyl-D-mannosaminuronate dehydrogenase